MIDSGASLHTLRDDAPVDDRETSHQINHVGTPTGNIMQSSCRANLKHALPDDARRAHCYQGLTYRSLVSVGQLCDSNYRIIFDDDRVEAINKTTNKVDMVGKRD